MKFADESLYLNYTELYTKNDTAAMEKLEAQIKTYGKYFDTVICPAFQKPLSHSTSAAAVFMTGRSLP